MEGGCFSPRESAFVQSHRATCPECGLYEVQLDSAMDMLRGQDFRTEVSSVFDSHVIRKHRIQSVRDSFRYWMPALIGAAVAGVALLAMLHAISRPAGLPIFRSSGAESATKSEEQVPSFEMIPVEQSLR